MSRAQRRIDAAEDRAVRHAMEAADAKGRAAGAAETARAVNGQLATRISELSARLSHLSTNLGRAVLDMRTLRRIVAEHLVATIDPADDGVSAREMATALQDVLAAHGINLTQEMTWARYQAAERSRTAGIAGGA